MPLNSANSLVLPQLAATDGSISHSIEGEFEEPTFGASLIRSNLNSSHLLSIWSILWENLTGSFPSNRPVNVTRDFDERGLWEHVQTKKSSQAVSTEDLLQQRIFCILMLALAHFRSCLQQWILNICMATEQAIEHDSKSGKECSTKQAATQQLNLVVSGTFKVQAMNILDYVTYNDDLPISYQLVKEILHTHTPLVQSPGISIYLPPRLLLFLGDDHASLWKTWPIIQLKVSPFTLLDKRAYLSSNPLNPYMSSLLRTGRDMEKLNIITLKMM